MTAQEANELRASLQQWKERSVIEFGFLNEDGLSDSDALDTVIGKLVGSSAHQSSPDAFSSEEIDKLVLEMNGQFDQADAIRALRVKREIATLRESGMDQTAIVKELLKRINRPAGFKRVGRTSSTTPSLPSTPSSSSSSAASHSTTPSTPATSTTKSELRKSSKTTWGFSFSSTSTKPPAQSCPVEPREKKPRIQSS